MTVFAGRIDPENDVQGVPSIVNTRSLIDETNERGLQDGATATGNGTTDNVTAPVSNIQTATVAGAAFTASMVGKFVDIANMVNGANNGSFLCTARTGTTISYVNASGVVEANIPATFDIYAPYAARDNVDFAATDRKNIKGTASHVTDVPTYVRPSAIGTNVPANLTNIAGKTSDASAEVINVRQKDIKLRSSINDTDGSVALASEVLTLTNMHITASDLDSFVTLTDVGAVGATGTYRIKAVGAGNSITLDGLSVSTAGTVSWILEGNLKGILTSRGYADTVDRRGIPIADTGAEDQTIYDATFVDVIEPIAGGRPVEEDGDEIFARSFGDEKDPNATVTNEAVRFFIQLLTGLNTGAAVASVLESISGRSGSAASVTNSSNNVTGLSGMSSSDVGKYLPLYSTGTDGHQGHRKITAYVSATEVTVDGSAFGADANNGSIKWKVSRHPGNWDFYNGDRYRGDEVSETAHRTTLIGGIVSDSELVLDIAQVREFIGAADGDTTPAVDNSTADYVLSTLGNPADTDLEEIVNALNDEVGNRTFTGSTLTSGQTISASLQALSNAIGASSLTRVIERLTANVPKNTAHTLPGGNTYTLDGADNGANMYITWRKLWRDPGPRATQSNDYEETSTTSITPYEKIKNQDSINYMLLQ